MCKLGRVGVGAEPWVRVSLEAAWELNVETELSCGPGSLSLSLWRIQLELFCCVGSYSDALAE